MSKSWNKVELIGHLGKNLTCREITGKDGKPLTIVNATMATNETRSNVEYTEWHRLVFFGKLAEVANKLYTTGKQLFVSGRLQTKRWTDKEGTERFTTEIVVNDSMLLGKAPRNDEPVPDAAYGDYAMAAATSGSGQFKDDDIPF